MQHYDRKTAFSVLNVNILSKTSTQTADLDKIKNAIREMFMLFRIKPFLSKSVGGLLNQS